MMTQCVVVRYVFHGERHTHHTHAHTLQEAGAMGRCEIGLSKMMPHKS